MRYYNNVIAANDLLDHPWVISLDLAKTEEEILLLISTRILKPEIIGPPLGISSTTHINERAIDLILDLSECQVIDSILLEKAIKLGIGEIISPGKDSDLFSNLEPEDKSKLLASLFNIIEELLLENCADEVAYWVSSNIAFKNSSNLDTLKLFKAGLQAFAAIQEYSVELEEFWTSIWYTGSSELWEVAFKGLMLWSPERAMELFPSLLDRGLNDQASMFVLRFWLSKKTRPAFEHYLVSNMLKDYQWPGLLVNSFLKIASEDNKALFFQEIKKAIKNHKLLTLYQT